MDNTKIKPCIVTVRFDNGREYPYFNDKFELEIGDKVYVDGKLYGRLGTVIDKTYQFKVSKTFYKYVINKLDFDVHGVFINQGEFMIAKGTDIINSEQFISWFKPPFVPTQDSPNPEEFFIGNGYSFNFCELECSTTTMDNAIELLESFAVKGIFVENGAGVAVIQDKHTHIIDFKISEEGITDMYCDCMDAYFCEHLAAVCLAIRLFVEEKCINKGDNFFAICKELFFKIIKNKNITI